MAEIATVMAGFAWFFMIRNGVQTLYNDSDTWRDFKDFWKGVETRLLVQEETLKKWKAKWMFYPNIPDAMFIEFWGMDGLQNVEVTLKRILRDAEELSKYLKNMGSEDSRRRSIRSRAFYGFRKVQFVLMEKSRFTRICMRLSTDIGHIDELADTHWRKQSSSRTGRSELADEDNIYHHGIKTQLSHFSLVTRSMADALLRRIQGGQDIDMALDLLWVSTKKRNPIEEKDNETSEHMCAIATACNKSLPELGLTCRRDPDSQIRVAVTEIKPANASLGAVHPLELAGALDEVKAGVPKICVVNTQPGEYRYFKVELDPFTQFDPHLHFTALDLLFGDPGNGLPSKMRQNLKIRLAYELSLAFFMLYCSRWASTICICNLSTAAQRDGGKREFTIDTRLIMNNSADAAGQSHCSCQPGQALSPPSSWPFHAPLRRLGILLVRIASGGKTVLEVNYDNRGRVSSLKLEGCPASFDCSVNYETLFEHIKDGLVGMKALEDSLDHCLRGMPSERETPDDNEKTKCMEEFYEKVVRVLRETYKKTKGPSDRLS